MRLIGHLPVESSARTFGGFLYASGIDNQLEFEPGAGWGVWINEEDKVPEAVAFLERFRANPSDAIYTSKAAQADDLRAQKQKEDEAYRKRVHGPAHVFRSIGGYGLGPLTLALILISVAVFLISGFGDDPRPISFLFISDYLNAGLREIKSGQIWRLVTPIFIHFGMLHILFNMMWMYDLGNMIEGRLGTMQLGILVVVIAVCSNLGQYFMSGPVFGGMSGVVYGLLGYVWLRGKFDPASGLFLHQTTVLMMMIWFFVCLTGLVGRVANTAHAVGLGLGMAWGYLSSLRSR